MDEAQGQAVLTVGDLSPAAIQGLLEPWGLATEWVPSASDIPGSYWGNPEAGLRLDADRPTLYVRSDTPVHSALHEACHVLCMDSARRAGLDTDAGGDDQEENGVCYLQILLADQLPGVGSARLMADMDRWGYSFRLGSTRAWFEQDAEDARNWLLTHGLIDEHGRPSGRPRI